ncbi:transposase, partial [Patescibacteria group bacterium]
AFCLNPNHYHFILMPLVENGVQKFMHKLGTGYTCHFNEKYKRSGSLFQGRYKAIHIESNEYLLHLGVYVNLNNRVHKIGKSTLLWKSSWNEYTGKSKTNFCKKDIILGQFRNVKDYIEFAESSLEGIIERKEDMKSLLLED